MRCFAPNALIHQQEIRLGFEGQGDSFCFTGIEVLSCTNQAGVGYVLTSDPGCRLDALRRRGDCPPMTTSCQTALGMTICP